MTKILEKTQLLLPLLCLLGVALFVAGQEKSDPGEYEVVTQGLLANRGVSMPFRSARVRLEIRNLVMGQASAEKVPIPTTVIMELRGGTVTTTIDGQQQERRPGDFWTVEKGRVLSIANPGEVAVIRAIYIFERGK